MPSSYSNNGLELIAPGEQENTWGTTTNDNWELVDEAIDGYVNITSVSTTQSLTVTDGTSSNGRHKVIRYTGSPSGAVTVTISPNTTQKVYMISNEYNQSITFTQGSGGDVTITAGNSATIFTDGAGAGAQVFEYTSTLQIPTIAVTGGTISGVAVSSSTITGTTISGSTINNDVTGNLTGNVTGNVTGDVTGNLTGNLLSSTATAVTQSAGNNSTRVATTAFVASAVTLATGSLGTMSTQNSGAVSLTGGTIDNVPIGNTTRNTGKFTTVAANAGYTLSSWTITEQSGSLILTYGGTKRGKLDSLGNIVVTGNVTGYGTI